jgi:nucleotide-binding universal stress UspA family protein
VLLICFDGSEDAGAAITRAGALMPGQQATVLTIWQGVSRVASRARAGFVLSGLHIEDIDASSKQRAAEIAGRGVELARSAGLDARPRVREQGAKTWATIVALADELDAGAIVMGSRGLSGVRSLWLGSVSHAVAQHAGRAVLVVPARPPGAENSAT